MADGRALDGESEPNENEPVLTYELTYKDVVDILKIVDSSACREVRIELGDFKLTVVKRGSRVPRLAAGQAEVILDETPAAKANTVSRDRGKGVPEKKGQ